MSGLVRLTTSFARCASQPALALGKAVSRTMGKYGEITRFNRVAQSSLFTLPRIRSAKIMGQTSGSFNVPRQMLKSGEASAGRCFSSVNQLMTNESLETIIKLVKALLMVSGIGFPTYYLTELGLVSANPLFTRTPQQQAKLYEEAKKTLTVIGISGLRLVDDKIDATENPIKSVLLNLVKQNPEGEVRLMIYDLSKAHELNLTSADREKLKKAYELAKKISAQYPNFQVRLLSKIPPFHGDLIDDKKAVIVRIRITGMKDTQNIIAETYDAKKSLPTFSDIEADFNQLWETSTKL
jgi:hypothetical protein